MTPTPTPPPMTPAPRAPGPVNLRQKVASIPALWTPGIVGELNGQYVKLARVQGEFIWHTHDDEDECFVVLQGRLRIEFRDGEVTIEEGEMYVVPRGVEHRPVAEQECHLLLFEPVSTRHTGTVDDPRTAKSLEWI